MYFCETHNFKFGVYDVNFQESIDTQEKKVFTPLKYLQ